MATDRWIGQVLGGRYKIEELLGQGGMSAVYKARDPNLQRTVAIKLIHSHLSNNEEFVRRFESEATSIAKLRHPNIVQVYDFNHEDDLYYMVLEYVAGETLQSRIKRLNKTSRYLPVQDALRYTIDVCRAADYAHQRGLIHRDIKPANVMLDVSGNAILMDFGIARMLGGQQHTATGAVLGTALYMSPEQIQGLHPDARSDIYSIGVTLFEALGGRPPFEADSVMTLMMMHLNDPVPDLTKLHPGIPVEVKAVVDRALEKDRNLRYQTCTEMADALQKAMSSLGTQEAAAAPVETQTPAAPPVPVMETIIEPPVPAPLSATIIEPPVTTAPDKAAAGDDDLAKPAVEQTEPAAATVINATQAPAAVPAIRNKAVMWGGLAALVLVLAVGGYFLFNSLGSGKTPPPDGVVAALSTATEAVPAVISQPTATEAPPPTATFEPSATPTEEIVPTATEAAPTAPVIGGADKIAYLAANDIWVANVNGTDPQQITRDGTAKKNLRWLPSGTGLTYISGKCIEMVELGLDPVTITCFNYAEYLDSFEVSPDGARVALSLDRLLYLLPFNLDALGNANSHPDLVAMADCPELAPYQRNAGIGARWSQDSKTLAVIALGVLEGGRRGDMIQVIAVDRCINNPAVQVQFPEPHFTFGEYARTPTLTSFAWDGGSLFAMTGLTRNDSFGEMHIFNRENFKATLSVNPMNSVCCYSDVQFSPDGNYLLFAFQDMTLGASSVTRVYYVPFGTLGTGAKYDPLPMIEYTNPKEQPHLILRPALTP